MKLKNVLVGVLLGLALVIPLSSSVISGCNVVYATNDLGDDIGSNTTDDSGNGMSDFISNWENVDDEKLGESAVKLSPITDMIGYLIGGATVLVVALIPLITVLDIAYIAIPPIRNLLFVDGQQAPTGGYGGFGGMQQQQTTHEKRQWVSDEAVQCASLIGNNQQSGVMSNGGPMGFQTQQTQQNMPTKSVIGMYFKKRLVFIILFSVCLIVLTSSILLGTGANLAQWLLNIIQEINSYIPR